MCYVLLMAGEECGYVLDCYTIKTHLLRLKYSYTTCFVRTICQYRYNKYMPLLTKIYIYLLCLAILQRGR